MLMTSAAKMRFHSDTYWPTKPASATGTVCWVPPLRYSNGVKKSFQTVTALSTSAVTVTGLSMGKTTYRKASSGPQPSMAAASSTLIEAGYWLLPKPLDMSGLFFDVMGAANYSMPIPELAAVKAKGAFHPELSVFASLAFAVGLLWLAAYEFRKTDY